MYKNVINNIKIYKIIIKNKSLNSNLKKIARLNTKA